MEQIGSILRRLTAEETLPPARRAHRRLPRPRYHVRILVTDLLTEETKGIAHLIRGSKDVQRLTRQAKRLVGGRLYRFQTKKGGNDHGA